MTFPGADVYHQVLTKDEGGRYTPFMANYRPQLFIRTADITVALSFPSGTPDAAEKMVMPGDHVEMVCELVHDVAAEVGSRFTLREGGKTGQFLRYFTSIINTHLYYFYSRHRYHYQDLDLGSDKVIDCVLEGFFLRLVICTSQLCILKVDRFHCYTQAALLIISAPSSHSLSVII